MNVIARSMALLLTVSVLTAGCADPAADVTAAKVGDAVPTVETDPVSSPTDPAVPDAEVTSDVVETAHSVAVEEPDSADALTVAFDGTTSKIDFVGSKLVGGGHDGGFKTFDGAFVLTPDEKDVASVSAKIDMNSLWSDNDNLTGHLKNEDFFEVETYPESEFVSTSIAPASAETEGATHEVTGNLTMHGTTKSITFPATVKVTEAAVSLESEFKIDRTIWGIVYGAESDVRDKVINKDVVIRLTLNGDRDSSFVTPAQSAQ